MKKIRLVVASLVLALFTLAIQSNLSYANAKEPSEPIIEIIKPEDPEEFIKEMGWEKPTPNAKLDHIVRIRPSDNGAAHNQQKIDEDLTAKALGYSIKVTRQSSSCGVQPKARVSGTGNIDGNLVLSQTVEVSNSFSSNTSVSAEVVTASVGFDVTEKKSKTAQYTVNTNGKNYQIVAYDDFDRFEFDVYLFGAKTGTGVASKQVGFCYAAYQI
ncbi:hypothetical protein [Aneurinibacillus aneurinilyticus]|uniref:Uncharacterized protein n=1 Tax=Aneurinibacillus aneurinilyticus ATCC 12856 TaxID=649747 RepID=U1YM10_ANEAE|nr:hypothetical protein [Aneurinibacillus aneurinilyticus]ERI11811.1 hypothetical protein HMPREF0083_00088 [Aneurinibacillus aneurinilyticus ATCC 12856]MED0709595.1 hypothetical protein [Aneurinibacillus aneurinilyticus]MED0724861.1 hypothetical protein [Aneurinibacillus aneurinilyticus]MED0735383.1 hypothetical protein [Aneurinibacillus aneurinilyticus]MED0742375.1 hypothetical protein [Aneurinibacillus aneurinilyticus]